MILKVVLIVLGLAAAIAVYAAIRTPPVVRISRSRTIQASPEKLFPYINEPRHIMEWNPFTEGDDALKVAYDGPAAGVGAQWSWEGSKAGIGRVTITASEPNRRVGLRLDFKKPFDVSNSGSYALEPKGDATEVIWTVDETALIPRVISVFLSLDNVVGGMFDKGLTKLETLVRA